MTDDLAKDIAAVSREEAIEAAGFIATELGVTTAGAKGAATAVGSWAGHPYRHLDEAEELARLLLSVAATDPELETTVRNALDGAGRKQVVLGGAEIVALATLALGALQICLSRGRTGEDTAESIETKLDGTVTIVRTRNTKWGISSSLGDLLKGVYATATK